MKSDEKMKVETQQVESKTVVVIEQANPEVVYVPIITRRSFGERWHYPYPYMYYPPYGYYGAAYLGYGAGIAIGIAWGGGWGWGSRLGKQQYQYQPEQQLRKPLQQQQNMNRGNRVNPLGSGNNSWQHNPQHRGGAPYPNRDIANRYGGSARGDSNIKSAVECTTEPRRQ